MLKRYIPLSIFVMFSITFSQSYYSLSFDGVDDYIKHNSDLPDPNGTYELLFKADDIDSHQIVMVMHGSYNNWMYIYDGMINMRVENAVGEEDDTALTAQITVNTWHHIAVTYDYNGSATNVKFWLDGQLVDSASYTVN